MARDYTTINEQTSYDLAIQQFGSLNNIDKVLRQVTDLNQPEVYGVDMVFEDTENNLALRFQANDERFATSDISEIAPIYRTFDNTFDNTFY